MQRYTFARFPLKSEPTRPTRRAEGSREELWPETQTAPDAADASPQPENVSAEESYQEGYEKGFQEGHQQGYEQGAQETQQQLTAALEEHFNSLLEALKSGAAAIEQERERQRRQLEEWLPRAALLLSEQVLQHELQTNKEALLDLLRQTLREFPTGKPVRVHLNPADYERLAEQPPEVWNTEHLTFVPDESVTPGGAIVEGEEQVVDARLESRLLEAARQLLFPQEDNGNDT